MRYNDPKFVRSKRLTAEDYDEFYGLLLGMLAKISSYREAKLHSVQVDRPERAGWYSFSPFAKTAEEYLAIAKRALVDARWYYVLADAYYERAHGESMGINVEKFATLLTYGRLEPLRDEEGRVYLDNASQKGYNALVWIRKTIKELQGYSARLLSPIEIRREMYSRADPIDWSSCKTVPEPEQLAFCVDANGECEFGSEPLDAPKKQKKRH